MSKSIIKDHHWQAYISLKAAVEDYGDGLTMANIDPELLDQINLPGRAAEVFNEAEKLCDQLVGPRQ